MVLLPGCACCGSSPETGECASVCSESYSEIRATVSVGGSTGGHHLANPSSAVGVTPNEAVFPAVNATLVFDRYGATGLSQTLFTGSGVLSSSSRYSCQYNYGMTRVSQTGRFCSLRLLVYSESIVIDSLGYREIASTEHTFSFDSSNRLYYKLGRYWTGMPSSDPSNQSSSRTLEYTLYTQPGVPVNCGSQFPTNLTGTSGTGPIAAGLSYGDGGTFTYSSSPLIRWGSSYYRRIPQPEITLSFV